MTKRLVKTINGEACEVYAIIHHDRVRVGGAVPEIEVYEDSVEVPTIGTNSIRHKSTHFSIVLCPDPEMDAGMTAETLRGLTAFDLAMQLPRKDEVIVPFTVYGVASADLSPDRWEFEITDAETVRKLLAL